MKTAKNLLLVIVSFVSITASADVMQFSLCTFKDGKSMDDAQAWVVDWRKIIETVGKQYEVKLFNPNAGSHKIHPGRQFALVGSTPTLTTYGDGWDWWYSAKEAMKSRENLASIASCGANSIWVSTD